METAKIVTTSMLILALFLLYLVQLYRLDAGTRCHPSMCEGPIHQGYTRFADVERRCQSVLSSAAELKADADRDDGNLMYQLSFMDGDWSQDAGEAPLLPFHGSFADPAEAGPELFEAVPLVSFSLRHMDMAQRPGPRTSLNASGILSFTIARNSSCSYDPSFEMDPCPLPEFDLRPGIAKLQILFQGVYTETKSPGSGDGYGGGERVLCMVGDAVLPVRSSNSTNPWDWANNRGGGSSNLEPPIVSDGNILLVLRYPKTPTLTSRAVQGVMASTNANAKSDGAYFDTVRLVSQLSSGYWYGYSSSYKFRQEDAELDAAASFHEGDAMEHHRLNRGASPCDMIYQSIPINQVMEVIPNWDCKGNDEFCNRLGPFVCSRSRPVSATATNATEEDMAYTRSAIVVTGLQCKPMGGTAAARVAAVFRYVPPWEHQPMAAKRTGLSSMTLSAEGVWIPSTGRTHMDMVACLGVGKEACNFRVTLSVQTTVSMTGRGIVSGQITALDGRSHPPLLFQQRLYGRFVDYGTVQHMSYIYTKVDQARELLRACEPTGFRDSFVAKSLLSYPSVDTGARATNAEIADIVSLSNLAHELDLRYNCIGKLAPIVPEWIGRSFFELQILSAGTLVGRSYSPQVQRRSSMRIFQLFKRVHGEEERQQILNVSAEFMAYGSCLRPGPSPVMSLEGVYNAENGRMYLIGCRTVHASRRRLLSMSKDLEDGMDCSIEVIVEYPSTTMRWLISPTAKVFISSTRGDDEPLHFNRTELHMLPVKYQQRQWEWELREVAKLMVKGFLYIIALLATIWAATRTSP